MDTPAGERLAIPACHQAHFVEHDVFKGDSRTAVSMIRLEKLLEAVFHLERPPDAASDDRQVIGRVTPSCVLPVDHRWRALGSEEDVLAEQVTVQQCDGLGGRQVGLRPDAGPANIGPIEPIEHAQHFQCVLAAGAAAGQEVLEASAVEAMNRRHDLAQHLPRAHTRLPARAKVQLDAGHEPPDEGQTS